MKILFLHGLEGSPDGLKASYLKENYDAVVPDLDTAALLRLKKENESVAWESVDRYDILWAAREPLKQARQAIKEHEPDLIIGSSMGGAILAKMVIENAWSGPCIFLASAATLLFGIDKLPVGVGSKSMWVHGAGDTTVPVDHSMLMASRSSGSVEVVDDDHRLKRILALGTLDEAIRNIDESIN